MNDNKMKTRKLALNSILVALTTIIVFLAAVMPTNRLSLFALSSFFVCIAVVEFGIKNGWVFYITSCLLALIVVPNKIGVLPYVMFFGVYGLIKYHIERLNKIVLEYALKIIYFNIFLIFVIFIIREFFLSAIKVDFPWWIAIAAAEIVFIIYDYVYTLFIKYYRQKLKKLFKI